MLWLLVKQRVEDAKRYRTHGNFNSAPNNEIQQGVETGDQLEALPADLKRACHKPFSSQKHGEKCESGVEITPQAR